jgi:hypothetical protein
MNVAILGAGISGFAAARVLHQAGIAVTIFEARARIGGRVYTDSHDVDLGASFIRVSSVCPFTSSFHDVSDGTGTEKEPNSFMQFVEASKARVAPPIEKGSLFDIDGYRIPVEEASPVEHKFWSLWEEAIVYARTHSSEIPSATSLYDYYTEALKKEDTTFRRRVLHRAHFWGHIVGTKIEQQSLKFFYFEEVCLRSYQTAFLKPQIHYEIGSTWTYRFPDQHLPECIANARGSGQASRQIESRGGEGHTGGRKGHLDHRWWL